MGSTISLAVTYCACSTAGSLCNSCFGTTAAGTSGRKRSVLLLTAAIAIAFWFQYWVGPSIVTHSGWIWGTYKHIPGIGKMTYNAWYEPCEKYADDPKLLLQCAGNAGVYRPTFLASLFFTASAVATRFSPSLNREAWPAKYASFFLLVMASVLIPNDPLFSQFYLWVARFGATIFAVLQQVILIDVAYNWNADWVERSNQCDRVSYGSGQVWLKAIIASCVGLYALTIVGISLLYHYFGECAGNNWVISLSLVGVLALTAIQLSGNEGSLLTSAVISLYVVYLAFSIVSKNPEEKCNPRLGRNDALGVTIGLTLTFISLAWTGWSWSAEERLNVEGVQTTKGVHQNRSSSNAIDLDVPFLDPEDQPAQGVVMETDTLASNSNSIGGTALWKLNVVMALISCYVAMTLTGWGALEFALSDETHHAANPQVGRFNMAMIGISQWIAILLYMWTLTAPRLFPDRDFS